MQETLNQPQETKQYAAFPGLKEQADKFKAANKVEQTAVTVEPTEVSNPGTEELKQPVVVAETPKEQPKVETIPETTKEVPVQVEKPWDAEDSNEQITTPTTSYDFSKLGSALKLPEVKSEADVVTKFNELQTKLQEFETKKAATFEGVPDELKEVINLAKEGVDWKSYLGASTVDWSKYHPADVYEAEFAKLPNFRNPDGTLNQQALDDALDAVPEAQKAFEGQKIIQQRLFEQNQFKQQQIAQARLRKEQSDRALLEATKNLSQLLPEDRYGIKFEPKHSDYLFKGISDGSLLQKHFLNDQGQYDMKKVTETIAKAEWGEKMIKYHADKAKVSTKKEVLNQTQNVQLDTPRTSVAPDDASKVQKSASEKMKAWQESLSKRGQL
jgi:hypothetical protein